MILLLGIDKGICMLSKQEIQEVTEPLGSETLIIWLMHKQVTSTYLKMSAYYMISNKQLGYTDYS